LAPQKQFKLTLNQIFDKKKIMEQSGYAGDISTLVRVQFRARKKEVRLKSV